MRWQILFISVAFLSACSPATPAATPTATTPALVGSVDIQYPEDGTTIYSEVLYVSGTSEGLPGDMFRLQVVGADDAIIAQNTIVADSDGPWQIEIPHGYSGEPVEATIYAVPADETVPGDYDVAGIVISGQSYRPEGTFGSIISPINGTAVDSDTIEVSGTASGVFENTFTLELLDSTGSMLNQQFVIVTNPYFIDEAPWKATLLTGDYTGAATIRAYAISARDGSEIDMGSVNITIG